MTDGPAGRGGAALRAAQLLLVVAAGALWGASRLPWVIIHSSDGLGQPRTVAVSGASWSTALVPLALLSLATAVAAVAVHGWKLRVLAVLMAAVSLASGYLAVSMWVSRDIALRALDIAEIPVTSLLSTERRLAGAVLSLVAALCLLVAAALLMRAAARDTGADVKYAAPAVRRKAARDLGAGLQSDPGAPQMSERMMWDALDEGYDPTDPRSGREAEGR